MKVKFSQWYWELIRGSNERVASVILPIGQEVEFRIKNDDMFVKPPDGDDKTRSYEVVSMEPASANRGAAKRDK